jgi:hypothetical protein
MAEPVSLALGGVSLLIQFMSGIKKGKKCCSRKPLGHILTRALAVHHFNVASNMPADCEYLSWQLQLEYSFLLDWAEQAGLNVYATDGASESKKNQTLRGKLKVDPAIVSGVLAETEKIMVLLVEMSRSYISSTAQRRASNTTVPKSPTSADIPIRPRALSPQPPLLPRPKKVTIDLVPDVDIFEAALRGTGLIQAKKEASTGFRHIVRWARELKERSSFIVHQPRSIVWSVHHKAKFETTLQRFHELNTYLSRILGDYQADALRNQVKEVQLALLNLATTVEQKAALWKAVQSSDEHTVNGDVSIRSFDSQATTLINAPGQHVGLYALGSDGDPIHHESLFERLIRFSLDYAEWNSGRLATSEVFEWLNSDQVTLTDTDSADSTSAIYHDSHVWVEWKEYTKVAIGSSESEVVEGPNPEVEKRVQALAALLMHAQRPAEFSVPTCLGIFKDTAQNRWGFVYDLPLSGTHQPLSLLHLLSDTKRRPLSIKSRVHIAQSLSVSLLYLHAVGWLHRGLRSASIVFLPEKDGKNVSQPYISGFEFARQDQHGLTATTLPQDPTWSVYCHPDYHAASRPGTKEPKFRKSYDMYSLGIVLLEIALWKPAVDIFAEQTNDNTSATAGAQMTTQNDGTNGGQTTVARNGHKRQVTPNARTILLKQECPIMEQVRDKMGDRFHNAVKALVTGPEYFKMGPNVDQTDREVSVMLQQGFIRLVVDALSSITL